MKGDKNTERLPKNLIESKEFAAKKFGIVLMTKKGAVHRVPADLQKALISTPKAQEAWEDITPLARNEWICWIESAKKPEMRSRRIERTRTELIDGERRPCCWAGCSHH